MIRLTICLPDELASLVQYEARRRRESVSGVVRAALGQQLLAKPDPSRPLPFAGIGHSGSRHTARDAEKLLEREWGRARRR